jgi:hypothetical protein
MKVTIEKEQIESAIKDYIGKHFHITPGRIKSMIPRKNKGSELVGYTIEVNEIKDGKDED